MYQPIRSFPTADVALRQALERMDQSVWRAFAEELLLGIRRMPHRRVATETRAQFDEVLEVNAYSNEVVINLPPITPADIDRVVEIVIVDGTNDIVVRATQTISSAGGGTTEETWAAGTFGIIRYKACLSGWQGYRA